MNDEPLDKEVIDEPPPFLGTWPRVYAMVMAYLVVLIIAVYVFTRAFAP